jgi:outer membrane protein assembly factor BamB
MRGSRQPKQSISSGGVARATRVDLLSAALLVGSLSLVSAPATATAALSVAGPSVVTGHSSAFDWTEFHGGPMLQGFAANSPISAANAGRLGVAWATDLYSAALDSPVVYYDSALGETLAYIGTEHGDLIAVNLGDGKIVWSRWLGSAIRATPIVSNGWVFIGTTDSRRIYKLDASTGVVGCSVASPDLIEGTPVAVTPPGGVATVYFGTYGPLLAVSERNCAIEWSFARFVIPSGTWDPVSYALDATGEPLVLFGTADPDSRVYALNAVTGKQVWRFAVYNPPPRTYDVGAGVTISPPGSGGFPGGAAYVSSKYGIMYALDLTTGAQIWSYNFRALGLSGGNISTAALAGENLVFGYWGGLADVNAVTGKLKWSDHNPGNAKVDSSPAVAGSSEPIVAAGDLAGGFDVASLATGSELYHYKTAGYITASPAVSDGNILIASSDGFLYDFAAGGGNDALLPATTVTSPAQSSTVANPVGRLEVRGTSTDPVGVAAVVVAVQADGPKGPWWNASNGTWSPGPVGDLATVTRSGAKSSDWTLSYRVPTEGGTYQLTADAVSASGQADVKGASVSFVVLATRTGPQITASPQFVAPGAGVTLTGSGFARSERVIISLLGTTLATTRATAAGNLPSTRTTIPGSAAFGLTTLSASGETSGKSTTVAITVANSWAEVGRDSAHTGFEPDDNSLYDHVSPGDNIFLDLAWKYQASAPIETAPVIANGVAYVGDTAGKVIAIDVHNGAGLWTSSLPSEGTPGGSLAVDAARGLVFVGADDGTLDAISTFRGKLKWTAAVGGHVSSPVVGDREIYATSSTGVVEAVSELTGSKSWSVHLQSTISAAPSLDTTTNTLVVGESNGDVVALAANSGASRWTYASGGAIGAPAMVAGDTVYFGSGNSVFALNEKTGAKIWSYRTGGAVADTPLLTNSYTAGQPVPDLLIGAGDGSLYRLGARNGSLVWKLPVSTGPIIGLAAVREVVIFNTSSGLIGAAFFWAQRMWHYQTSAAITSPPAIVDGAVYVGAGDGALYAFTPYGGSPS